MIIEYSIKVLTSTALVYLSVFFVSRGNYRNTLAPTFLTAVIFSTFSYVPLFFLFGLLMWVYVLINWYNIGFMRSFLCAFLYGALFLVVNVLLGTTLISASFINIKAINSGIAGKIREDAGKAYEYITVTLPDEVREKVSLQKKNISHIPREMHLLPQEYLFVLKNGNEIECSVISEREDSYVVDIAEGNSEIIIRKDIVERIEKR